MSSERERVTFSECEEDWTLKLFLCSSRTFSISSLVVIDCNPLLVLDCMSLFKLLSVNRSKRDDSKFKRKDTMITLCDTTRAKVLPKKIKGLTSCNFGPKRKRGWESSWNRREVMIMDMVEDGAVDDDDRFQPNGKSDEQEEE